jgi:hypothetical protein
MTRMLSEDLFLFRDVFLPGTHNSSTSNITSSSRVTPGAPAYLRLFKTVAVQWSRCQERSIFQQLLDGIRVFDLRTCRVNNRVYTCHGLANKPLSQVMQHEFLRFHALHPNEIITIFSKLDWDYQQTLDPEAVTEEADQHVQVLRKWLEDKLYVEMENDNFQLKRIWKARTPFLLLTPSATCRLVWLNASTEEELYTKACELCSLC